MPGKSGGSEFDRTYFKTKMKNDLTFRQTFFQLLTSLGPAYWIEVADANKSVQEFSSPDELWQFTDRDDWRSYYFIIGRDYVLGSEELLNSHIQQTILTEFGKLMPLYKHMKDPHA